ncbi:MAG: FAD-dependent oxidoreductase [Propionibacteriaceae bacterium]|jgi:NADPH-dependent 2,4-dienoyl-CoA reductase/sulfur reductase-like enzyme/rhodanese-related sulfurtransferase|nr:FAD-dependent oxidoreductase [Propionibacteriaceae bacterium]
MHIVIVGGVAGGMSCAARARRLDERAEIIVLDRGDHVSFANCGLPYFVGGEIADRDKLLIHTPDSLKAALNLDVRTRHDVTGLDAKAQTVTVRTESGSDTIGYDALVLSPGAQMIRPPLPGLDSPRVHSLRTVGDAETLHDLATRGAKRAVVLGAGFIGLEAAEALARRGLAVSVVELAGHVLPPLESELAALVTAELRRLGITVRDSIAATAIESGAEHDTVILADGSQINADLVILSVGVRPDTAVFEASGVACERGAIIVDEHGRTNLPGVWAIGDAVLSTDAVLGLRRPVALAGPANRAGRLVADDIVRPDIARPIPQPLGTAIVRVGDLTAAMTGANHTALEARGIGHHTIHLHPNQHAGYFPDAHQIHLVVHFRDSDGRLLGAQGVGREGVDKRIDVLAGAIRNRAAVDDLIDLDLSYAPPYGNAKDPVNMVGMIGENLRNGTTRLWYHWDLEQVAKTALILDTRSRDEFAAGHLPQALNIPHTELRARLGEVTATAAGRPVRVMCQSGVRSYLAHRILADNGFDSATLSGGIITLRDALGPQAGDLLQTATTFQGGTHG